MPTTKRESAFARGYGGVLSLYPTRRRFSVLFHGRNLAGKSPSQGIQEDWEVLEQTIASVLSESIREQHDAIRTKSTAQDTD